MQAKITNPYGPNTTVLLPGDCNAHCDFCFWNREEANIPFDHTFSEKAIKQLERLPKMFSVLSVSGGEPLLSPEYTRFCMALVKNRERLGLERLVLTTHGKYLAKFLDVTLATFDHINISRHAIGYEANVEVFKTKNIPTDAELETVIRKIHKLSRVDVTLNCVVPANVTKKFCEDFIEYAKRLGADAVSFRKIASNAKPTKAELAFRKKFLLLSETECPVCRGAVQEDDTGFSIRWKGSVNEPSIETNGVYEAVLHPDAKIYTDWNRKVPFPFSAWKARVQKVSRIIPQSELLPFPVKRVRKVQEQRTTGCGGNGGGCGGGGFSGGGCGGGGCGSLSR